MAWMSHGATAQKAGVAGICMLKTLCIVIRKFDFLVIGSGVAGMSYALQAAASGKGKVALVCKTQIEEANTAKAQGGIASVTDLDVDDFNKHIRDTLIARFSSDDSDTFAVFFASVRASR